MILFVLCESLYILIMSDNQVETKYKIKKNKSVSKKHVCGTCGKSFTRKTFYDKHIIGCENIYKSEYRRECDKEERDCLPSQMQLYRMLLDLTSKYETLNAEVQTLRNYVERTKKKINIIDWLNTNCDDCELFDSWLKKIDVDEQQLQNTFKLGYVDGVYLVLQQYLPLNNTEHHAIKCFDQKKGLFFCRTEEGWIMMSEILITQLIRQVNHKLMSQFLIWKNEHKDEIDNNDRFYDKYVDYMKLVLGGNMTKEQSYKKLKSKLYNYLKCDLKNIIQYEFIF